MDDKYTVTEALRIIADKIGRIRIPVGEAETADALREIRGEILAVTQAIEQMAAAAAETEEAAEDVIPG